MNISITPAQFHIQIKISATLKMQHFFQGFRVSPSGGLAPPSYDFFSKSPHQNQCPSWGTPPPPAHKNEAPNWKTPPPPPHWKVKPPSKKWFLEKNQKKSETVINICVSIIKQHWKKMAEIPQECNFFTWSIQNFVRKVKQFVRKYYITRSIDLTNKLYNARKFLISFYPICY